MFYLKPDVASAYPLFFYRNFAANNASYCHVGLGINALHSVKVLRKAGVRCDLHGVWTARDVAAKLSANPECTHAIIEAPWIPAECVESLMIAHPDVHFIVRAHSQIGFLQVEPGAIRIIRDVMHLAERSLNLSLAANSERLRHFLQGTYDGECLHLPNLYHVAGIRTSRWRPPGTRDSIRIGSFGALRILKNHTTSAAAAMMVARNLGSDLEFHVSVNREEHGRGVLQSLRNMFSCLRWATLVEVPWSVWPDFRRAIAGMDLCFQLSMSETFNITTADAAAGQVPSVVGEAIEWAPDDWKADPDSVEDAARRGAWLLHDREAGRRGREALESYVAGATATWAEYLGSNPT
jgi:hypothetical protein